MSYLTQIILKQGITNPGTVLSLAEPAYDTSANLLYVGNGIGNAATLIGPISVDEFATIEYVDGSLGALAGVYTTFEYVDGSLAAIPVPDVTKEYVDGSLGALAGVYTTFEYVDGSLAAIPIADVTKEYVDGSLGTKYDKPINTDVILGLNAVSDPSYAGSQNVVIGNNADDVMTGGIDNTIIGFEAGQFIYDGQQNIIIGSGANPDGDDSNSIVIGYQAAGKGSNTTVLGNSSCIETYLYGQLFIDDVSVNFGNVETYTFVTGDTEVPTPTGSNRILGIKNISAGDVSVYILGGATIDNLTSKVLLSMNTLDIYDYDATNWYIV